MRRAKFPYFKSLRIEDQAIIDSFNARYPSHSDFDFASLWSWNVNDRVKWCEWKDMIAFRMADYSTREPFYTFHGEGSDCASAAEMLLALAEREGLAPILRLISHDAASSLNPAAFILETCADDADYLYDLRDHLCFQGAGLRNHRHQLNRFLAHHPDYRATTLDLAGPETRRAVRDLWGRWARNRGGDVPNETRALERFLRRHACFNVCATAMEVDGKIVGANITVLLPNGYGANLFEKADIRYVGVYSALTREVARSLFARGRRVLNAQQDLGLPGLPRAKLGLRPCAMLAKYSVRMREKALPRTHADLVTGVNA